MLLMVMLLAISCGGKRDEELTHEERIDKLFSPYDGSNEAVVNWIKEHIKDPDSYKHLETKFSDQNTYIHVITTFTATNSYGGRVKSICDARIDTVGNLITAKLTE